MKVDKNKKKRVSKRMKQRLSIAAQKAWIRKKWRERKVKAKS